ncbi:MAG: hypothetical protein ACPKM0_05715 [Pleomorphochaeta sp.]|nr:hypothetical protein [Sphaerochaetaceae bacterium]
MKKRVSKLLLLCLFSIVFISCDFLFAPEDLYYWSLVDEFTEKNEDNEDEVIVLEKRYDSLETLIVMTCGENDEDIENDSPGFPTRNEAEIRMPDITFQVSVEDSSITFTPGTKTVKELSDNDFHIYQEYAMSGVELGKTYTLIGKTIDSSNSNAIIEEGEIKIKFK